MEQSKIIVGLDIGTTKICVIVGKRNAYSKLEILGMGNAESEGVINGMVVNIEKTIASIEKAVTIASDMSEVEIKKVNVGIAGKHIRSNVHRGGITREQMDTEITVSDVNRLTQEMYRIVMPPGSKIIHVMPQIYSVDYEHQIKDPVGMSGVKLEADFHIISAQVAAINNINKCIQRAGMECQDLILEPLASSMSVLSEEEKEAGVCLIDIGGGTTDMAIFHDNIIRHTAVIPFGGNIVTTDIQYGLKVMARQAEQLKTQFGKAIAEEASANEIALIPGIRLREPKEISVKNLAAIIEARMREIIEMAHTEILHSGFSDQLSGGIVLTGGGALLKGLRQLVEFMTGLDVRIGYPNEHLGKSKVEDVKSPMYATAVGLVLAGFRSIDEREERYRQSTQKNELNTLQKKKKPETNRSFMFEFINKTKALLMDDLNDRNEY